MAIRIPRVAQPGQLGNVASDQAPTPFQDLKLPSLDSGAKGLAAASKAVSDLIPEVEKFQRDQENLALLETQDAGNKAVFEIKQTALAERGGNAVGAGARAAAKIEELKNILGDGKGLSPAGQLAHGRYIQGLEDSTRTSIGTHESEQTRLHRIELSNTAMANSINTAVEAPTSDTAINNGIQMIAQQANNLAKEMASDPKEQKAIAEKIARESNSILYVQAINRMLAPNSEGDPTNLPRAKELLAMGKAAGMFNATKGDLARAESAVGAVVEGSKARDIGNKMFGKFGDDAVGAAVAIEALNVSAEVKRRATAQFESRRVVVDAQEKRVYQERVDALSKRVGNDETLGDVDYVGIKAPDKAALQAAQAHAAKVKAGGPIVTDDAAKQEWDGLTLTERANLSYADLLTRYANKFSSVDKTRENAIAAWRTAVGSKTTTDLTSIRRLDDQTRAAKKSLASQAETDFHRLSDARALQLWPGTTDSTRRKRAAFKEAATRAFGRRNTETNPMTAVEVEDLIDSLGSRVVIEGTEATGANLLTTGVDDAGRPLKGSINLADVFFAGIHEDDRFRALRWYRREKGLEADATVDTEDGLFGAFINKISQIEAPTDPRELAFLKASMKKHMNISNPTPGQLKDFHRRLVLAKQGR